MIYKFCPYCKSDIKLDDNVYSCSSCNQKIYIDPKPTVNILPIKDNKVLINKRAIEPYKGEYDLLGGFTNSNETIEEAVIREMKEETNLDIKIIKYFGSYTDVYGENGNPVLAMTFLVEITGGEMKPQDDVAELEWIEIKEMPNLKLNGFKNTKESLNDLYKYIVGDR